MKEKSSCFHNHLDLQLENDYTNIQIDASVLDREVILLVKPKKYSNKNEKNCRYTSEKYKEFGLSSPNYEILRLINAQKTFRL